MNTHRQFRLHSITTFVTRILLLTFAIAVMLIASASPTAAQSRESRDIDHPVRITSSELLRPIAGNREIFYSFNAGPGELTITLDMLQKSMGAVVYVTLYNQDARQIAYFYGWGQSQTIREIKRVSFSNRQSVLMKITVTNSKDNYDGNFRLRLSGAVERLQSSAAVVSNPDPGANLSPVSKAGSVMRVVMKDGSTQDIDISRVQRVTFIPAN